MSAVQRDASSSRVYMTTRNYRGPSLHQNIRGRSDYASASPSSSTSAHNFDMKAVHEKDLLKLPEDSDDEANILKLPESSDEEASSAEVDRRSNGSGNGKRKADPFDEVQPPTKRVARAAERPTRASQRQAHKEKNQANQEPQPEASSTDLADIFLSQSSQSKKRRPGTTYGRASSYLSSSQGNGFADPGEIPTTPRKTYGSSFTKPDATPSSRKRSLKKNIKDVGIPDAHLDKPAITFKMPEEYGLPLSSSTTTELSNDFDGDNSPKVSTRKRSSSTSSLSSIDSMASYELTEKQKDELGNGMASQEPIPSGSIRCPLCHKIVDLSTYAPQPDPTSASLRKQQTFCLTHRTNDAHAEWQDKGYPIIDWKALEKRRIPKHKVHLRKVLDRQTPSFYFETLEAAIKKAKGNQSKIRRYLAHEIVEVVKPGYYGPKGAKVMSHKITTDMSSDLKRILKADKTVRTVGVSAFVSAVLLPETLQRIVMEDMGISNDSEARRLISNSTDAGMLLWPDDDHVVRDDGDVDGDEIVETVN